MGGSKYLLVGIGLAAPVGAWAFCGTYVGGAGAEIYNHVSEVVYVRIGDRTTLTLHSDALGDTDDFAMLVPVPEVIGPDDIHTVDAGVIQALDDYSAPRRVRYSCDDFRSEEADADTDTDTDADTDADTDWDVEVEAEYVVGEYSVAILSSGDAGDLQGWLNQHGYATPPDEGGILQSYIDQGTYFLAARLHEHGVLPSDGRLSPLQFSYTAEAMSLPIRIGTLNAEGVQDLIIYALTPYDSGQVAISNYPEATLEESCLWLPPEGNMLNDEQFAAFYLDQLDQAYKEQGAFWVREYAWGGGKCDPCEGDPPTGDQLFTLGFPEENIDSSYMDLFFTRLHMRYAPHEARADVMLYPSNLQVQAQQRYIDYLYELEDRFPTCGQGFPTDPGSCDPSSPPEGEEEDDSAAGGGGPEDSGGGEEGRGGGCRGEDGAAAAAGLLIGLGLLGGPHRRRRRPQ